MIKYSEMNLRKKLIISLVVFVFMPLILFSLLFFVLMFRSEMRNLEQIQIKENQKSVERLEQIFEYSNTIYSNLLYEYYIEHFIDQRANMTQHYELSQYLDDLLARYPYYKNFVIYDEYGIKYQRGVHLEGIPENIFMTDRSYELSFWTKPHKLKVSPIYKSSESDVLSYSYKLLRYSKDGADVYGVLEINFDPSKMYEDVFRRSDWLEEKVVLIDNQGINYLGKKVSVPGKKIAEYKKLRKFMNKETGMFYTFYNHEPQICYYHSVDNNSFYIVRFVAFSYLIVNQFSVLMPALFLTIICLLFACLFSKIQKIYVIQPLSEISAELKKIEKGNFCIRLSNNSKDEIGDLGKRVLKMAERLEHLIKDNYIQKIKQQEAEMNALVTQINPHFLYNTLDSIHWVAIRQNNYEISSQIEALSTMFRHILNKGKNTIVIADEMEFLKSYVLIMNKRYNDKIQFFIEIDDENIEELKAYSILKLLIQPLIENCFVHGLNNIEKGIIVLRFYTIKDNLYIEVEDNGKGIDFDIYKIRQDEKDLANKYSALKNIYDRIQLFYGKQYGMYIEGKTGKGTCIILKLPYRINIEQCGGD